MPFIRLLASTYEKSDKVGKNILHSATRHQIFCLAELFVNILAGNIPLPIEVKQSLAKSKVILRKIRHLSIYNDDQEEILKEFYKKHYKTVIKCLSKSLPYIEEIIE